MSIVCERFVQADMPRTGTVYVSKVLLRKGRLPRAVMRLTDGAAAHLPAWWLRLKGYGEGRTILATVRSPYSWYPSWWAWMRLHGPDHLKGRSFDEALDAALDGEPLSIGLDPQELGAHWPSTGSTWEKATRYYTQNAPGDWAADVLLCGDLGHELAKLGLVDDLPPKHVSKSLPVLTRAQEQRISDVDGGFWLEVLAKLNERRAA